MALESQATLEKITSLCKRRGFVYQSAEIYGGLNGVYDYGPLGVLLKQNIKKIWLEAMHGIAGSMIQFDGSLLGHQEVWRASGHVDNFSDPMVDCLQCKHRYRTDEISLDKACPHCGVMQWTPIRQFNMMFKTEIGASASCNTIAYLRPETAQSIFSNFKNIIATNRLKIPFGVAQIGKAFRNEITPKQFLFRMREFEQMEMEWFCTPAQASDGFKFWLEDRFNFYTTFLGFKNSHIRIRHHTNDELSHYSSSTADIEYKFPFGWKELEGIANRGDFDLKQHSSHSGKDLSLFDETLNQSYIPNIVETSVGVDRLFLTTLFDAYDEEIVDNEQRIVLRLKPSIAPIKAAVFPLTKNQTEQAHNVYTSLKRCGISVQYDESGSIGKRYRRHDEIGTPFCITLDFESENNKTATIRHRDSMKQDIIGLLDIANYIIQETKTN